jgi:hypothetical protein
MFSEEVLVVFGEEFIIKESKVRPGYASGWHNGERITEVINDKFKVLKNIVLYYEDNFMTVESYIDNMNIGARIWKKEDLKNRFVVVLPKDIGYWKEKGIDSVPQLRNYLKSWSENGFLKCW